MEDQGRIRIPPRSFTLTMKHDHQSNISSSILSSTKQLKHADASNGRDIQVIDDHASKTTHKNSCPSQQGSDSIAISAKPQLLDDAGTSKIREPHDSSNNKPTIIQTCELWSECTSIHGMYYAFNREHFKPWKQTIWAILVIIAATALLWALVTEFQDFAQYNLDTTTRTIISSMLEFPRITICNSNAMYAPSAVMRNANETEPTNEEELIAISQPLEEFILYTEINEKKYTTQEELKSIWTPTITHNGLCFSFKTDEKVYVPGSLSGLQVWTWLDQQSYRPSTTWAGVPVFVSSGSDTMASSQTNGAVRIPPGSASSVALNMQEYHREEQHPWSYCISGEETVEACRLDCIASATSIKCGCRIIGDTSSTLPYCASSSDYNCTSFMTEVELEVCASCSMLLPCREQEVRYPKALLNISHQPMELQQKR